MRRLCWWTAPTAGRASPGGTAPVAAAAAAAAAARLVLAPRFLASALRSRRSSGSGARTSGARRCASGPTSRMPPSTSTSTSTDASLRAAAAAAAAAEAASAAAALPSASSSSTGTSTIVMRSPASSWCSTMICKGGGRAGRAVLAYSQPAQHSPAWAPVTRPHLRALLRLGLQARALRVLGRDGRLERQSQRRCRRHQPGRLPQVRSSGGSN